MKASHSSSRISGLYKIMTIMLVVCQLGLMPRQVRASIIYWDPDSTVTGNSPDGTGLGGSGLWDLSAAQWWDGFTSIAWSAMSEDTAVFSAPYSLLPTLSTVTLSSGLTAAQLFFLRGGYLLSPGDVTLGGSAPTLWAGWAVTATINSQILGTNGLTMLGGGTIRLGNNSSSYTGTTTISNGSLVITGQGALGADTSAIVVTGYNPIVGSTALRGVPAGSLVLDGSAAGITISRDLSLQGQGVISDRGGALISTGDNILSGTVTMGTAYAGTFLNTRMIVADGSLALTGTLNVLGTAGTTISSLGGINQTGVSTYKITGALAGAGTLESSGGGTLYLAPSDSSGFSGVIRVSASAASGQNEVRIGSPGVLGTRTSTTTSSVLDMNGGILSVLMDTPSVTVSNGTAANVYGRASSTFFVDHAVNSTAHDQAVTFGQLAFEENLTLTFNGRNGYGITFSAAPVQGGNNNSTFTNNLQGGGLLTFTGNFWSDTDNTASRTMTIGGNGDTLISGSIIASAAAFDHNIVKSGSGTLTITGTASTLDGSVSINGGTVEISDWRSITNNTATINIGSSTTAGTLSIIGSNVALANLTTSKVINLAGTTGAATILANQTGSSPGLVLNADFAATGGTSANAKTLTLGGASTAQNTINGVIPNNDAGGTVSLTKVDAGTWVLAGANLYTGATTITNGTLRLKANAATSTILADTSAITFNQVNQYAGGTLEFVGQSGANNVETLGVLTPTLGSGTIRLTPGSGGTVSLVFASLGTVGAGSSVNIVTPDSSSTVSFTTTSISNNIANAALFYNGSDFAFVPGAGQALRTPNYASDADFATSATALTSAKSNQVTGSFSNAAVTIDSLKINGSQVLTMTGLLTVRTAGTANASGGIIQTGGSGAISGTGVTTGGSGMLVINVDGAVNTLTLNAPVTSTTTGGFTKVGAGTLIIAGLNAQTGTNSINEGTVQLSGSGRLGGGGSTATLSIRQGAVFDLNGVNVTTGIDDFNNNGTVTNTSASSVTLTIGTGNGGGTSFGIISETNGVINLTKLGTGAMTWNGLSTYTGVTTIGSTGIITVTALANGGLASSIGAAGGDAGNLVFTGTSSTQAYGGLAYTGATNAFTDHLFTFNGGADGGIRIQASGANNATLSFTSSGALAFGSTAAGNAQGLVLGGTSTGDNHFAPAINDNGSALTSVYKADAGVWFLDGANGYSGATEIRGGILFAQDGTGLPTTSNLVFNGGVFGSTGTLSRTIGTGAGQMSFATPAAGTAAFRGGFTAGGTQLIVDWGAAPVWGGTAGFLDTHDGFIFGAAQGTTAVSEADVLLASGFSLGTASNTSYGPGLSFTIAQNSSTVTVASTAGLAVGQSVTGTNIPAGAYIVSINSATQFSLSSNTANTSGIAGTYTDGQILGNTLRAIRVDDNTSSGGDFTTISGVITGDPGTGIRKLGTGILVLSGANTYSGETNVYQGTLVVSSLGLSTGTGATSVGTEVGASLDANALTLGNGSTTAGILEYVGAGEISDRKIRLNTTTGNTQIHADGTGALILTNVANDMVAGAKTLYLRGVNEAGNMITSQLADNGGALSIVVDGSATWILSGNNLYTGTTTITGGALGIGSDTAFGTSAITFTNGALFAYGADRVISNPVTEGNTSSAIEAFYGDYSITFNGDWTNPTTTASGRYIRNNIASGKTLTINGSYTFTAVTTGTSWNFDGSGDTIINGVISNTLGTMGITYAGSGSLTLGGANTYNGATTISRGTLKLGASEVIPDGAGKGNVVFNPIAGDTATLDLNGHSETINGLSASAAGTSVIDNTSSTSATLVVGANDQTSSYAGQISNTGSGALSVTKTGAGTTTLSQGPYAYTGSTVVNGGTLIFGGNVTSTTSLIVTNSSTLAINGGFTGSTGVSSLTVDAGSTLSLSLDNAGTPLSSLTALNLGTAGVGTVTLKLNIGDLNIAGDNLGSDTLTLLAGGTLSLGSTITFNMSDAGLNPNQTYTLLNVVGGGLDAFGHSKLVQGLTPGGFSSYTWIVTDNLVQIQLGSLVTGVSYWRGLTDSTWNGATNNWSTDKAGAISASTLPGAGTDVIFQWDSGTSAAVSTTLEQSFKINSLTFEASTTPANTPASISIASGVDPAFRLQVAPQVATDGVKITSGGPAAVTISAPFKLGADQTWSVADAASALSFTGALQGEQKVTISGSGKIILGAAADSTFNSGSTSTFTITGGTLEIQNVSSLGSSVLGTAAGIILNGGAFYYNGVAGTVGNAITLGGGTLSAGAANQIYSGPISITGASAINMRDLNSATTSATARSITLSGVLSGSGRLTVDSVDTLTAGNAETGTLTISNNSNTWNGELFMNRGTVVTTATNGLGGGDITFNQLGRVIMRAINGITYNLAGAMNFSAGAIGEFSVDNTSAVLGADFVVNQNGVVTIGAGAAVRFSMADVASQLNLTGSVILAGNASISVEGGDADSFVTISGPISDGGSGYSLAVHDDLGAWAATDTILRLTGASTFSGDVTLASGTLQYTTVSNIGGPASSLGQGSAFTLGSAILSFIGSADQSTNRTITTTASTTLAANGVGAARITYDGAITQGVDQSLTLNGTGAGTISGGITQPAGTAVADLVVASGDWTIQGASVSIADDLLLNGGTLTLQNVAFGLADDIVVSGSTSVLNLNSVGVWAPATPSGTSSFLYARGGGVINLNSDDINGVANANGSDGILLADSTTTGTGTLNTNGFAITVPRLDLGSIAPGFDGVVTGAGVITGTYTGTDYAQGFRLFSGTISASLAGGTTILKQGLGTVTLSGDNSGLTGAVAVSTRLDSGNLILDYTTSNTVKLPANRGLDIRGGTLTIMANASAATSVVLQSFTLGNGGSSQIVLNASPGQDVLLNLGAITRANASQDGTIRFFLPAGAQTATNGIITSTTLTNGLLGTAAFATVDDGTGVWFATKSGNNIVALVSTVKNDISTWAAGDHVTDSTTGITGAMQAGLTIASLRLDAAAGSDITLSPNGILNIASGGILLTSNVGGSPSIKGGALASGASEIIVIQDSSQTFEISSAIRINYALTKSGSGTLLLTGNNVYSDETEIQDGTLQVSGGNAIGDSSLVTLADDHANMLQLLDDEVIGRLQGGSASTGLNTLAVVDIGTHTLTVNQTSNTSYAGLFTGTGTLIERGSSNLNLTNVSSGFTGTVIVDSGMLQLSGVGQIAASIIQVNKWGALIIDDTGTTRSGTRIADTTAINLNSADGGFGGQTIVRGFAIRTDQDTTLDETVGVVTAASGANYVGMEATTANDDSDIVVADIKRTNNATLNIRGTNLGTTNARSNQFRIVAGGDAAFISSSLVGGGGAAGSKNISIVPWAVGEDIGANALAAGNMGNSLVTYVSGSGFRPLDFATEYNTLSLAGATDNARESLSADLTGLAGKTVNALVLDNAAAPSVSVMGSGSGQSLGVTSGALLFTVTGAAVNTAYTTTLGGFDSGISAGGTNEYVISVINPNSSSSLTSGSTTLGSTAVTVASTTGLLPGMSVVGAGIAPGSTVVSVTDATHFVISLASTLSTSSQTFQYSTLENLTAIISSPLNSTADITKSGRGTLVLSGANTAGGGSNKTTLNEGVLEISSLSSIGGASGALVFAGGTLRLGAGLADDISLRTITFLQGGGVIDTNGMDFALAHSVGSGVGSFTKAGAGNLMLNAAATYTGDTLVLGGALTVGADNATGLGGDLTLAGGATLDVGGYHITAGLVSTMGESPVILGSGTITAAAGFFFGNTGDIGVDAMLAGAGGLLKTQTNMLTLSGTSTFTGAVEIQAGTLRFNSIYNVGGGASALGSPTNAQNGVIHMGLASTATTLIYTGSGSTSDRTIGMQGTTGAVTVDSSGTGALVLGGVHFETAGSKTLTLKGLSDPALANTLGAINEYGMGVLTLVKSDTNTWVLSAANAYSGATSINDGILRFTADQNLSGALNFGSANTITTAGMLDLASASASFGGAMLVQTNTSAETNQFVVGSGESLTINGTVTLGSGAASSTTLFSASGAGAFNVTNTTGTGVTFLVGNSNTNISTADFSALSTMNVTLNTTGGILQVGSTSGTNSTGYGTLILAQNTTITASALTVGGGGSYNGNSGQINALKLGSSANVVNVDAVNVGTGSRDIGSITFLDAGGTLVIRGSDGVSAAAFNMGTGTSSTSAALPVGNRNTFDVTGHNADLLFSAVNIGTQNARTGAMDNLFAFDTGTLTAGNLTMGSKTAAGNSTNVMNIGGGAVTFGSGTGNAAVLGSNTSTGVVSAVINVSGGAVTFGSGAGQALVMGGGNTSATGSISAALNVSGGSVALATTGPVAVTMASASAGTATASITVTGGALTVQGDIVKGAGAGARNASITLNGGTLDMTGKVIGDSVSPITFNAQSGTLKNIAELNGGGAFVKTTTGTLYMDGVNSCTGTTTVSAGTLQFVKETALYNGAQSSWTDASITVAFGATAAFNVGGAGEFTSADVDVIKSLGTSTTGFKDGSFIGLDTTNASGGAFTYDGVIADTFGGVNFVGLKKLGANALVLTQTSTYSGATTVSAGTLQVGDGTSGALAGSGSVSVSAGATLSGSGSIAGATVISSGAVLAPGVGATGTSNQTLTFTAVNTAVDVKDGGQILLSITSSSQTDAAFDPSGSALSYLNSHGGATGTAYTTIWDQSGSYDSIKLVNGTFNLGTTSGGTIKLLDNGATLTAGSIFKLLDWSTVGTPDSVAGSGGFTLADLDLSSLTLGSGLTWDTSAFTTYGVIVVVPEPSRMLFLMLGLSNILLRRRRKVR